MFLEKFKKYSRPFSFWGGDCSYDGAEIVIITVPYDGTCSNLAGCRKGPTAIIDESMEIGSYDIELDIDAADKIFTLDPLVVLDDSQKTQNILQKITEQIISDKKTPIIIGGDHSLTPAAVFAIKNVIAKDFFILHFDAHSDLRKEYRENIFSHASCMHRIASNGFKITQVGIRNTSKEINKSGLFKNHISVFRKKDIFSDLTPHLLDFKNQNVYVSFDFDAYDPSIMPCVGTPEPDGLMFKDACFVFNILSKLNIQILGADFMEFSPHNFQYNAPANLAVHTIGKVISLIALQNIKRRQQ